MRERDRAVRVALGITEIDAARTMRLSRWTVRKWEAGEPLRFRRHIRRLREFYDALRVELVEREALAEHLARLDVAE